MLVDAGTQIGLVLQFLLHLLVARQPFAHHGVEHRDGFRVITKQHFHGGHLVFVVQTLQLFDLSVQILQPGKVALVVCEVEPDRLAFDGHDLVDVLDLVLVQACLEYLAVSVAGCAALHASLVHHHQQWPQLLGRVDP
ncbi:hypothetical protein D3C77_458440 [compost metagenome]